MFPTIQRSANRAPALNRNREPSPAEHAFLEEERELNRSLIGYLTTEMEIRITRAKDAFENVQLKAREHEGAELRLEAADSLVNTLNGVKKTILLSIAQIQRAQASLPSLPSLPLNPNFDSLSETEEQLQACQNFISNQLFKANVSSRVALEAIARSLEEQQDALGREEQCNAMVRATRHHISEIKTIGNSRTNRTIWRIPEMIWRQIFSTLVDVTTAQTVDREDICGQMEFPSLRISTVCRLWRVIAKDHRTLWQDIHLALSPLTPKDAERINYYIHLSKPQSLRVFIYIPTKATAPQEELDILSNVFGVTRQVESLVVKGSSAGQQVVECMSQVINPPKRLTIAFPDNSSFQRLNFTRSKAEQLEVLILKNCSPAGVLGASPTTCKMVTLHVENATSQPIQWGRFRERFLPLAGTLRTLILDTCFSEDLAESVMPKPLPNLLSFRTPLQTLSIFYKAKLFTPALELLTIILTDKESSVDWSAYAADRHGGANITEVKVEVASTGPSKLDTSLLRLLPRLKTLSLSGGAVDPVLDSLASRRSLYGTGLPASRPSVYFVEAPSGVTSDTRKPLSALERLIISDFPGDGANVVSFASRYSPRFTTESNSGHDAERGLEVELHSCPGMSTNVLWSLREMGVDIFLPMTAREEQ